MNHTFSTIFYLKKDIRSSAEKAPIVLRITVNGKRGEISTKRNIEPSNWDVKSGRARGNKEDARVINEHLVNLEHKVLKLHASMVDNGELITARKIKEKLTNAGGNKKTILQVFNYHNEMVKAQIGKEFALGTYKRFETTCKHIKEFIEYQYRIDDVALSELRFQFITELEFYLKTVKNCNHNSALKYIRNFRKIVNIAIKNEWMDKDPFLKFQVKLKETKRGYLTQEELEIIENKEIAIERLDQVRDVFVFCCYTGLAYADIEKLSRKEVSKGIDGNYWIFTERQKTGTDSNVPLLPRAMELIEKYKANPGTLDSDNLLPVISNQKMNAYLKELAIICGIDKNLTFHMARHTFATTVTLTNGVPIESVSSMLGHKNIKTTQIYAKVVQRKVSDDMMILRSKLAGDPKKAVNQ